LKIRTLIVEDEPLAQRTLRDFAAEFSWLDIVGVAADGLDALRVINEIKPQLIFLDVRIPELSGLEVLRRIDYLPAIVFTTAFEEYAVTAFEFEAIDYLQKPFGRDRFRQTIERVLRRMQDSNTEKQTSEKSFDNIAKNNELISRLFVRDKRGLIPLPVEEIVRLKAEGDYTKIYTKDKSFLVDSTLKDFSTKLNPENFLRVHRSAVVNLNHITRIEEDDRRLILYMNGGAEVQASRAGTLLLKNLIA
jgi:two-component system LytT family response regulator